VVRDPLGQEHTFHRNALGWLEWEQDPRGRSAATNRRGRLPRYVFMGSAFVRGQHVHDATVLFTGYNVVPPPPCSRSSVSVVRRRIARKVSPRLPATA
jgi:hypothetical protein